MKRNSVYTLKWIIDILFAICLWVVVGIHIEYGQVAWWLVHLLTGISGVLLGFRICLYSVKQHIARSDQKHD